MYYKKYFAFFFSEEESVESPTSPAESWVVVDEEEVKPQPDTFNKTIRLVDEMTRENNGVTIIINLLQNILKGSTLSRDSFLRSRELATLGVVLAKIDGRIIDAHVLMSIQNLYETLLGSNELLMACVLQYIICNFSIWSRCDFGIRVGHVQYLSTLIKDNPTYFRAKFGTQFILDVIRTHYLSDSTTKDPTEMMAKISDDEARIIRGSLLGMCQIKNRIL